MQEALNKWFFRDLLIASIENVTEAACKCARPSRDCSALSQARNQETTVVQQITQIA